MSASAPCLNTSWERTTVGARLVLAARMFLYHLQLPSFMARAPEESVRVRYFVFPYPRITLLQTGRLAGHRCLASPNPFGHSRLACDLEPLSGHYPMLHLLHRLASALWGPQLL